MKRQSIIILMILLVTFSAYSGQSSLTGGLGIRMGYWPEDTAGGTEKIYETFRLSAHIEALFSPEEFFSPGLQLFAASALIQKADKPFTVDVTPRLLGNLNFTEFNLQLFTGYNMELRQAYEQAPFETGHSLEAGGALTFDFIYLGYSLLIPLSQNTYEESGTSKVQHRMELAFRFPNK